MKKLLKYCLLHPLISWSFFIYSQNLVINPSFEEYSLCPPSMSAIQQYLPYANGWEDMAQSPDLFNVCNTGGVGVPYNTIGYQHARTGVGYSGIFKDNFTPSLQGREYMRGSLLCPLDSGVEYEVTYYVSQANDYSNCSNNFGVWFLTDVNYKPPTLSYIGKFHVNSTVMICDTLNWVEVKGTFVADSAYTYFIIGNPLNRDSTSFLLPPQGTLSQLQTYYYIDDVSVVSLSSVDDSIAGPDNLCNSGYAVYTAPTDQDILSYEWIVPSGLILLSGQQTSSSIIQADSSGTFEIQLVLNRGCVPDTLTKIIKVDTLFYSTLNDTSFCKGNSIPVDVSSLGISYQWFDASFNSSVLIDSAGTYWVEVFDGNCLTHYDFTVNEISFPIPSLNGPDSLCIKDEVGYFISGDSATFSYNWIIPSELLIVSGQTEDSISLIAISPAFTTLIQLAYENSCEKDTLSKMIYIASIPDVNLGDDTVICSGSTILLDAGTGNYTYNWPGNETTSSIQVNLADTYWVKVSEWNCNDSDTIIISQESVPDIYLGEDTNLCIGKSIEIELSINNVSYLWSTSEATSNITITESGIYWLEAEGLCGKDRDSISIAFEDCDSYLYCPNTFTPNTDGLNDIFLPKGIGIENFNMQIFDRWGNLIFTSNSISHGWDGLINGNKAALGIYVYHLSYSLSENDYQKQKNSIGRVTLLR
jgi:gliding motility-associated-like protein